MLGRSVGLGAEELAALGEPDRCDSFDETDRLVLRYAETLTQENLVDDALYSSLSATFSRDELIELCMTIAMAGMINRVHATFQTDVDEFTQSFLKDAAED